VLEWRRPPGAMLHSWRATAPAAAAQAAVLSGSAALLDIAPAVAAISRPQKVRAVTHQLLSRDEATLLAHVVSHQRQHGTRGLWSGGNRAPMDWDQGSVLSVGLPTCLSACLQEPSCSWAYVADSVQSVVCVEALIGQEVKV